MVLVKQRADVFASDKTSIKFLIQEDVPYGKKGQEQI